MEELLLKKKLVSVPLLRFPEFNESWSKKKFDDISTKIGSGKTPLGGDKVYKKEGVPFIRSQNVNNNALLLNDLVYLNEITHEEMKGSAIRPLDILLNITGASLGRSCVVPENFKTGNLNQHVCIIRLKKAEPFFVQPFLVSWKGQKMMLQAQTGSGREGLNFQSIRKFQILLPSLEEQQKIASFLSSVDKKLELLERKKVSLEAYKKGVMQKIFSREIRFMDEKGKEYPEWEEKKLQDIASFSKGKGISKNDISPEGKLECVRYGELYTHYNEVIEETISKTNVFEKELVLSRKNDVIIPASGETRFDIATASCVTREGIALGGDLNIIRSPQNGIFLSYYLNNVKRREIANVAQGNSVVHLYSKQLAKLRIELPDLKEQIKIVNFLKSIETKITSVDQQLAQIREFKKGLLQQMFV